MATALRSVLRPCLTTRPLGTIHTARRWHQISNPWAMSHAWVFERLWHSPFAHLNTTLLTRGDVKKIIRSVANFKGYNQKSDLDEHVIAALKNSKVKFDGLEFFLIKEEIVRSVKLNQFDEYNSYILPDKEALIKAFKSGQMFSRRLDLEVMDHLVESMAPEIADYFQGKKWQSYVIATIQVRKMCEPLDLDNQTKRAVVAYFVRQLEECAEEEVFKHVKRS